MVYLHIILDSSFNRLEGESLAIEGEKIQKP